jgi:hypothetical protein
VEDGERGDRRRAFRIGPGELDVKHFSFENLVDLAREFAPADERVAMRRHVATCVKCGRTLHMWQRVVAIARSEASYEPPEEAVRAVESAYLRQVQRISSPGRSLLAHLVFDSFRAPAAVGVRTLDLCSRQLLYERDDLAIDLRIETTGSSARSSLVGQLLHQAGRAQGRGGLPVTLLLGKAPVARTSTNPFGEFVFELELTKRHRIRIQLDANRSILVPLACLGEPPVAP